MTQSSDSTQSTTSSSTVSESCYPSSSNHSDYAAPTHAAMEDPTVIVGLACRVPGAQNPSQLWNNIMEQKDVQRTMPSDRFNVDAFYHPDGTNKGTTNAKYGYFLDQNLGEFDAGFFNISGREAEAMDPQQRILLEVVYEALEDAGIPLQSINGSQTSVFCGCFTNDYNAMTTKDLSTYPKYTVTGTGNSILANRISYFYNLHGPSATVDTACSSSLVCFHMGNQSIRNQESDISIVVGSALHFDPNIFITMTDLGMLSTDGRCRAFDASGRGYVRGEGVCAAILKRKGRAELDGDAIRAVVRSTAVNHDGKKQGITLPSSESQEELIRRTYSLAQIHPADTQYFEAHGTGTAAGDPREARAIGAVFSRDRDQPLDVGSVKTNIGHLEGASGIAGIIKATLALEHKTIPPNMHFQSPNPEIDFENWKINVPTRPKHWHSSNDVRRASINSFGYGGTNAHVILEKHDFAVQPQDQTPELPEQVAEMVYGRPYLLPLSSHSEKAGKLLTRSLSTYLERHPDMVVRDLAFSLAIRRSLHRYRSFAIGSNQETAVRELESPQPIAAWTSSKDATPRLGFVMTGQGGQWFAMGRQLVQKSPFFRETLLRCDDVLQRLPDSPDWSVVEELLRPKEASRLAETRFSQPICTALQLAILDLLTQWGIKPSGVVGHSSGEMAAAYAAGILSFESTIVAAYYRGLYMSNSIEGMESKPGAMLAVGMSEAETLAELSHYKGRVALAAINSPSTMTLSGDEDAIIELKGKLSERKVFARQLQVAQAFHSHHMYPLAPGYQKALAGHAGFGTKAAKQRMFSSVTARVADPSLMGASYWATNMTDTVRFSDALTGILLDDTDEQSVDILVEIGPHPALKGPSRQVLQSLKIDIPYLASLTRGVPDYEGLLALAGQLHMHGYPVDLVAANSDHFLGDNGLVSAVCSGHKLKNLPSYSWDHARYWAETRLIKNHRLRPDRHSLLGAAMPGSTASSPSWRNYLRLSELPWLAEHMIDGKVIFPAAGYVSMAVEAIARRVGNAVNIKDFTLRDVAVKSALSLSDQDVGTEVLLDLRPASASTRITAEVWHEFTVFSFDDEGRSTEHCRGLISAESGSPTAVERNKSYPSLRDLEKRSDRRILVQNYYEHLHSLGLQYGPAFRLLSGDLDSGPGFATAPLTFRQHQTSPEPPDACILHPTILDASLHVTFAAIESELGRPLDEAFVPTFLRSLKISGLFASPEAMANDHVFDVCSDTSLSSPRTATNDVRLHAKGTGELLVDMQGLQLTALGGDAEEDGPGRSLFFRTRWQPAFGFLGSSDYLSSTIDIEHIMDLFAHQHPDSRILHIGPDVESSKRALSTLGGRGGKRRRFQSYTPFPASHDEFRVLQDQWAPGLIRIEEPKVDSYDLVLVEGSTNQSVDAFVKAGGFVISNGSSISSDTMTPVFSNLDLEAWKTTESELKTTGSLTVVLAPNASDRTKAIASLLAAAYPGVVFNAVFTQLAELEQSGLSRNIVVLASLDEDLFFADPARDTANYNCVQSLLARGNRNVVWLLQGATMDAQKPEQAIISGLARSARSENDLLRLVMLDMAEESENDRISRRILQVLDSSIAEDELTEHNGTLFIPRIESDDMLNAKIPGGVNSGARSERLGQDKPLALKIGRVGLLETLVFSEDERLMDSECGEDELEIEVKASAINFRDIAAAMGIIEDHKLGDECSGVVRRKGSKVDDADFEIGDRVVAWRPGQGAHCTVIRNPASLCYKLGEMPFGIAAAMPLILTTAYYALVDVARLQPGETVLVHSAAGGVGQMAVQIAHMVGARVIATVGSQAKRDLLKSKFSLTDDQIFSSRDDSFVTGVMKVTHGSGVDVALNSLAGKLLHATWGCIAPFGRFVEIGKRDIHENSQIQMDPFRRNVVFASVDLITMFERNKPLGARLFRECCRLVHEGLISPPETITELSYEEAQKGFRLLQMGKHTGKVVLIPSPENKVPIVPCKFRKTQLFDSTRIYLLVGGLGGLGRTLAQWMVRKGARNLAFFSRSGAGTVDAKATVDWLLDRNIRVSVHQGDVTNYTEVQACIDDCGPGLAGVFQAAMVLKDAPLDRMSFAQWDACMQPKVHGTYNLHRATLHVPLDFFVCFSSVSAILGSKGQANYSAANAYIDALMLQRQRMGLKGMTMNCGMIVGVGAVAENAALQKVMERIGYDAVNEQELLFQIEEAVSASSSGTRSVSGYDQHQIITGVNLRRQDYFWAEKPLFRNLYLNHDLNVEASQQSASQNISVLLSTVTDVAERAKHLTASFVQKIAAVLGVAAESVRPQESLSAYGLDSIVAVEFRKWFSKSAGVDLAVFDILGSKSISALVTKVAGLIKVGSVESRPEKETKPTSGEQTDKLKVAQDQSLERGGRSLGQISSITRPKEVPMSTFQRRLWFAHNLNEDKTLLNFPVIFRLKGQPVTAALQRALLELQRRNESLRTSYFEGDNFAEQSPVDDVGVHLEYHDLSLAESPLTLLGEYESATYRQELNIEDGEVFRTTLAKLGESEYALLLVFHHIAIDRGSSKSFLSQLTSIYDAIQKGNDLSSVPSPEIQYADFSIWHNAQLQSPALESDTKFWQDKFRGASGSSKLLPFAKSERSAHSDRQRASHKVTLDLRMLNRMKRVCSRMGTTPFQFILTALRSFLYRHTEERDVTILMIDGNRPRPELEDVVGFFVNMIPLRCENDCGAGFDELLGEMKKVALEAMEHSRIPFDAIVDAVDVENDPGRFPLGQVAVNYQMHGKMPNYPTQDFNIYDVASKDVPTACELQLEAMEDPNTGLDLHLEYSTTLYDSDDMDRFLDNFLLFTTNVIKDHRQPVSEVPMCGAKEMQHLRDNYWATSFCPDPWQGTSVLQKIFEIAKSHPHSVAIQTSDDETITYEKLVRRSRKIAFTLRREGAVPGQFIGLFCRPGIDAVAAMLGILLVRCAYVPMDPDFVANRLAFMVSDSNCQIVLFGQGLEPAARDVAIKTESSLQTIAIDEAASKDDKLGLLKSASPKDPFYVIYTSGSTGKPKGVVLTQSNTQQMLSTLHHDYAFGSNDRFLHQSSICFDLSVVQIFSALTAGAVLCIASAATRKDPPLLANFMRQSAVTVTYFTPSQFALLLEYAKESLEACQNYRIAFFAGERLSVRVAKAFYDLEIPATLYNTWSPSEVVVQTTIHETAYPDPSTISIPIGYPLANCRHYITDSRLNPLPSGLIGEICVGGAQVGAGYLNRPDANASSFLNDPFCNEEDRARGWTKLFKTGDKGRFLPDGQLEFHGRIAGDKQIKLRGYRIDLAEVEQRLYLESSTEEGTAIVDVSVVARAIQPEETGKTDSTGSIASLTDNRQLVAFIVPRDRVEQEQRAAFVTSLHEKIGVHLNTYMLPNGYQFLDSLPVTIGGKVDRQSLLGRDLDLVLPLTGPSKDASNPHRRQGALDKTALRTTTDIFREVLKLPAEFQIAPTDNFFKLGGQSILLLRLQARIKRAFKVSLTLTDLLKAPTPAGVDACVSAKSRSKEMIGQSLTKQGMPKIKWSEETILPNDSRYRASLSSRKSNNTEVSEVLLTGVDSFIGVHMLQSLLSVPTLAKVNVIGTLSKLEHPMLVDYLERYGLLSENLTEESILSRVRCVPGVLTKPHFGLEAPSFQDLGQRIQAIYHFGGQISLLKTYSDLKPLNVSPVLDIIELAACGKDLTRIHHLSTWSVPHLQTWSAAKRTRSKIAISESTSAHFSPPATDDFGYFKTRWVSEMLMTQASERGLAVSIYRASAVTGSTLTRVPEPPDDFIRRMVMGMIDSGSIPKVGDAELPFAIDFIPVNYLVANLYKLSTGNVQSSTPPRHGEPPIYHLGNPKPLPLSRLPRLMSEIRGDETVGGSVGLEKWFEGILEHANEDDGLRWSLLRDYLRMGHVMFALDDEETNRMIQAVGGELDIPAVDARYLRSMWKGM
ncbi:MAG: hypothetical protein L6R37_002834 [Teloschistes peruensis]|nr:MAG: hypothetical protein L6R37_002834 [Teloschistes peruensis]